MNLCNVPACEQPRMGRGLCGAHYQRLRQNPDTNQHLAAVAIPAHMDSAHVYLCDCPTPEPHVPDSGAYFAGECAGCHRLIRGAT